MATMRGGGVGKERRITSPSSSTTKRSPKPLSSTKASSPSSSVTKASSPSASKSISNSLRPTLSSKNDPSKAPKKSVLDKPASKPALDRGRPLDRPLASSQVQPVLDRRRSFDRPPPSSQVQRTVQNGTTTRDVKTLRSSSFSNKTTTTPLAPSSSRRPATSTSVSSRKVSVKGGPQVSKAGGLRRSTLTNNTVKDSTKGHSSTKKGLERIPQEAASVDCETRSDSHIMNEDHVLENIDSELESLPEISDMSETANDLGDPTNIELQVKQPVEPDHSDIDTEDERHQEYDKLVVDDQIADELAVLDSIPHDQEDQIAGKHPDKDIHETVEETADDQKQIDSEKQDHAEHDAGENNEPEHEESNVAGENNEPEHKESNVEPAETLIEDKVVEEAEANKEQQTETTATVVTPSLRSHPSWKKENQAYNDVIEETATKLRLKKNKVLALAGAFETVISLQDTNNKH